MAIERKWLEVPPQAFTADGTQFGVVTVGSTSGFKVKASAYLTATGLPNLPVQIKRVLSPTQLIVGTINNAQIGQWPPLDIRAYTTAGSAAIGAELQSKSNIMPQDIEVATYEADPTVAVRVIFVDKFGNFYDLNNPLPIAFDGTINIGEITVVDATTHVPLKVESDGSINVNASIDFPGSIDITGTVSVDNFPATQTVDGAVDVSNFPATQNVSGSVSVDNFPATQNVSGSVDVNNFPATQNVDGTVAVSNFPVTQTVDGSVTVSGSVSVDNFPASQTVDGTVTANIGTTGGLALDSSLSDIHTDTGTTIPAKLDTLHTDNTSIETKLDTLATDLGTIHTDLSVGPVPISNANLDSPLSGIKTDLDSIHTDTGTTIPAKLDTLHTDTGTTIPAKLDVLHADNVTVEGKLDTIHTDTGTTIPAKLDTLHADNTAIETKLDTLHTDNVTVEGKLDTIATDITTTQPRKMQDGAGNALTSESLATGTKRALDVAVLDASGAQVDPTQIRTLTTTDNVTNTPKTIASATLTSVVGSASNVTLLNSNASRRMALFFNESTQVLYLKFGATASTTSYTVQIGAGGYYEMPQPVYTGQVDGIWAAANGNLRITEL